MTPPPDPQEDAPARPPDVAPVLSVVVPCRDGAGTVGRAVASALVDPVAVEVVVVDDGSTDGTSAAAAALAEDAPVRLVRLAGEGPAAARNAGADAAVAPALVFLDADDELLPGALARYAAALDEERAPLVRAPMVLARAGAEPGAGAVVVPEPTDPRRPHPRGTKSPGSFAVTADLFRAVGGYAPELRFGENTELLLRLGVAASASPWSTVLVDEPAVRVHRGAAAGRAARYGREPARAAAYVLARHATHLRHDPAVLADYRAIVGTDLARHGDRRGARRAFRGALAARPFSVRGWARLARASVPGWRWPPLGAD